MRRAIPWVALAVGITVALAAGYAAYLTADRAWNQLVDYESPHVEAGLPPASAGPALSGRVILVIVDGMRDEISREMGVVESLRAFGADITVETPQPSLSYPTWTTILSGAPHGVSGVTTNWYEGRVKVETLIDTALSARAGVVVVGPESFEELYGVERADGVYLEDWVEGDYLGGRLVEETLRLVEEVDPRLVVLYVPDMDEAAHSDGADSNHYGVIASNVDADLSRLVGALSDDDTTFVISADHGHIDAGGHGGWEDEVIRVPAVFAGGAVALAEEDALQTDIAPTVAALAGIPVPRNATGRVMTSVLPTAGADVLAPARAQRAAALAAYVQTVGGSAPSVVEFAQADDARLDALVAEAEADRLASDRRRRLALGAGIVGGTIVLLLVIGLVSWRGLAAASAGTVAYYAVYNGLFFLAHGHRWSLSAFNEEDMIQAFFNLRMIEAVAAALAGAAIAGLVYPFLRKDPQGARGPYLAGWLALGAVTVLVVQSTLGWQIGWYLWVWGADVTWRIPDLMWGFKFDLDLIQTTALAAAALLAPVVTWLVGRYHPRVRRVPVETDPAPEVPAGEE